MPGTLTDPIQAAWQRRWLEATTGKPHRVTPAGHGTYRVELGRPARRR